jgi:hypothetical protein
MALFFQIHAFDPQDRRRTPWALIQSKLLDLLSSLILFSSFKAEEVHPDYVRSHQS